MEEAFEVVPVFIFPEAKLCFIINPNHLFFQQIMKKFFKMKK